MSSLMDVAKRTRTMKWLNILLHTILYPYSIMFSVLKFYWDVRIRSTFFKSPARQALSVDKTIHTNEN